LETAFRIHSELRDYIRHESEEENAMLEQSLLSEGCRDPLVVWKEENVLVDGHHRFEICERRGIPYTVKYQSFSGVKEAKSWIRKNQLARRNLDKAERDQWIKEMRDGGWTQQAIADELQISKGRVSQIEKSLIAKHADQHSPKPESVENREKAELRQQIEYYERLTKTQEQDLAQVKKVLETIKDDRDRAENSRRELTKQVAEMRSQVPQVIEKIVEVEKPVIPPGVQEQLDAMKADREKLQTQIENMKKAGKNVEALEKKITDLHASYNRLSKKYDMDAERTKEAARMSNAVNEVRLYLEARKGTIEALAKRGIFDWMSSREILNVAELCHEYGELLTKATQIISIENAEGGIAYAERERFVNAQL
jgi:transcriptional regulator with XRE-family HTH domain